MKNEKRKKQFIRMLAAFMMVCILPVSDFSGLTRIMAYEEQNDEGMGAEGTESFETTPRPSEPSPSAAPEEVPPEKISTTLDEDVPALVLTCTSREEGAVILEWSLLPNENEEYLSYRVYRNENLMKYVSGASYTDTQAAATGRYIYKIRAYDGYGGFWQRAILWRCPWETTGWWMKNL